MKKLIKIALFTLPLGILLILVLADGAVFAQTNFQPPTFLPAEDVDIGGRGDVCIGLAGMIRSGDIHLRNLPCFIKFITQTIIGIAGSLSVIFVMLGGYRIVVSPNDEAKASGKKTITYALIGLAVTLLAWIIVDLVLQVATE